MVLYGMLRYGMTHAVRYMRLTKGVKVKHMFVSLGAIHFGDLFTLGLIHFAQYMRLTKGYKVKHMLVSLVVHCCTLSLCYLGAETGYGWEPPIAGCKI